jgi:predicted transcriptional regulator
MEKTTVCLQKELRVALKDIARRTGRPQAALIRDAIATYVAQQERPWPKTIGMGESGIVSGADSEDWLRENWKPDW